MMAQCTVGCLPQMADAVRRTQWSRCSDRLKGMFQSRCVAFAAVRVSRGRESAVTDTCHLGRGGNKARRWNLERRSFSWSVFRM